MTKPYCVWDIETSIYTSYKRKANPFDPRNFVVVHGWRFADGPLEHQYFGTLGKRPFNWFINLLDNSSLLVGMNIKFDLLHALQEPQNYEAWQKWVVNGGRVWDIQLAEYLLRGMEPSSHMLSLDELAVQYGGELKIDEVKALWEAGVSTEDIDPDLLLDYLLGKRGEDGERTGGDIGNTELIFKAQLAQARKVGQVKQILLNMGALLFTVEAERNGMYVDVELGKVLAKGLAQELAAAKLRLESHLPADLPFDFNWNSPAQKSALIFGGEVQYDSREYILPDGNTVLCSAYDPDVDGPLQYAQKEEVHYLLENGSSYSVAYYDLEHSAGTPLPDRQTYKSGKNAGEYKTKKVKVNDRTKPKARNCKAPYRFPGYTEPKKEWAGAVPGVYSTAAEVIEELGNRNIPFLKDLAAVTAMTKDLGTYYVTTDPKTGEQKGMLTLVQPDGVIHHSLNMCSTVTARLSSSNPNLQNIPKGKKSQVKTVFKSRFANGKIIQSDFTALEIYIQAILTMCRQLIEDLIAGLDLHCVRVSQKEGISYEEALYRCKDDSYEFYKEWDSKRTDAKVFSFQRAYGAGVQKISDSTGIPYEDVEALVEAELQRYPDIEPFFESVTEAIKRSRVPTCNFVQHPDFPAITCQLGKGYYRTPDNKLYSYREQPSPKYLAKRGTYQSFSPTEIKNYIVQGTGGEWAKAAMYLSLMLFYKYQNFGGKGLLVNQVHDAEYADAHPDVALTVAAALHASMEEASTFMGWYYGWEIPVPVPSDTTWGASMMDEDKITDEQFPVLVTQFKNELRELCMNNLQ